MEKQTDWTEARDQATNELQQSWNCYTKQRRLCMCYTWMLIRWSH